MLSLHIESDIEASFFASIVYIELRKLLLHNKTCCLVVLTTVLLIDLFWQYVLL